MILLWTIHLCMLHLFIYVFIFWWNNITSLWWCWNFFSRLVRLKLVPYTFSWKLTFKSTSIQSTRDELNRVPIPLFCFLFSTHVSQHIMALTILPTPSYSISQDMDLMSSMSLPLAVATSSWVICIRSHLRKVKHW